MEQDALRRSAARGLYVYLFGRPRLGIDGHPAKLAAPPRALHILAHLLLLRGAPIAREALAFAHWIDRPEEEARANLRRHLHALERALAALGAGQRAIRRDGALIALEPAAVAWWDVGEFEAAGDDIESLQRAARLYTGDLLESIDAEWVDPYREGLRSRQLANLDRLIDAARERGDLVRAMDWAQRRIRLDPYHEATLRTIMLLHAERGAASEALRAYRHFATTLQAELQCEPEPATVTLARSLAERAPPPASLGALPAESTSFVGRQHEIDQIAGLLASHRVVTLTGLPGVGKSRLALRVARQHARDHPDGVVFVDLAAIDGDRLVAQAIAAATRRGSVEAGEPLESWFSGLELLVVLDNCEHVLGGVSRALGRFLLAESRSRFLATSRSPLHVPGEVTWRLRPLPAPPQSVHDTETLLANQAVCLFLDRAKAARPDLHADRGTLAAIGAICRDLDGLPLALELAAAHLRSVSVGELERALVNRLDVLSGPGMPRTQHHRSLRAAFSWGDRLLSQEERRLLRRLAVFRGGWMVEDAAAVCMEGGGTPLAGPLRRLVDTCLVIPPPVDAPAPRYEMLQTTRDYAFEQLVAAGEADAIRRRHAWRFMERFGSIERELRGAKAHVYYDEIERDHANIQAALSTLIDERLDPEGGMRLALAISRYWFERSHLIDVPYALQVALEMQVGGAELRARATQCLAAITRNRGDYEQAFALLRRALDLVREVGDEIGEGRCLVLMSNTARMLGRFEDAKALALEGLALFTRLGDQYYRAYALSALGFATVNLRQNGAACKAFSEALDLFQRCGADADVALAFVNLANGYYYAGDLELAASFCQEGLSLATTLGHRYAQAHARLGLAIVALAREDTSTARSQLRELVPIAEQLWDNDVLMGVLDAASWYAAQAAESRAACALLAASEGMRERCRARRFPVDLPVYERSLARVRSLLDRATFEASWLRWRSAKIEDALAEIRGLL